MVVQRAVVVVPSAKQPPPPPPAEQPSLKRSVVQRAAVVVPSVKEEPPPPPPAEQPSLKQPAVDAEAFSNPDDDPEKEEEMPPQKLSKYNDDMEELRETKTASRKWSGCETSTDESFWTANNTVRRSNFKWSICKNRVQSLEEQLKSQKAIYETRLESLLHKQKRGGTKTKPRPDVLKPVGNEPKHPKEAPTNQQPDNKPKLRRNPITGFFLQPRGRPPKDSVWDEVVGVWNRQTKNGNKQEWM